VGCIDIDLEVSEIELEGVVLGSIELDLIVSLSLSQLLL